MNKVLYNRILVVLIISIFPFIIKGQGNSDSSDISGTYTFQIESTKGANIEITDEIKSQIVENRREDEDYLLRIGDYSILIMSNQKMEAEIKWPKYSIKEK